MSDLQNAALPLAAMLVAFVIIGFSLMLSRHVSRWVEKKRHDVKPESDETDGCTKEAESAPDDSDDQIKS